MKKNLLLILILIFAFLIRLIAIDQSLWLDEAIQAYSASNFGLWDLLTKYMPGDFSPPLYHLIIWFWAKVFGLGELSLRFPSIIFGVLSVLLVFNFLKNYLVKKTNQTYLVIGTLVFATAPLLIYYSQEARMYQLACFLGLWSMLSFYNFFILKKGKYWPYLLSTSLMFWSHYLVWFLWPTQLLILFFTAKKELKLNLKKLLIPLLSIILLLPILLSQLKVGLGASDDLIVWKNLSTFSFHQLLLIPAKIIAGRVSLDLNLVTFLSLAIPLLLWLFIVFKDIVSYKNQKLEVNLKQKKETLFFLSWLILPILMGIILSFKIAIFTYFRFLFIVPAFYFLLILAASKLKQKKGILILLLFLIINVVFSLSYFVNSNYHREDWRNLVAYVDEQNLSKNVVILDSVSRPFWYYDQGEHNLVDYAEVEDIRFEKSVWLIKYAQPIFDSENKIENILINDYGFIELKEKHFQGNLIIKYLVNPNALFAYDNWN
jgi:uncharacterized membrane protein